MARTVRLKVYKFSELNDKAKEKAIERFRDINIDYNWWDSVYEDFKIKAKEKGFDVENIYFSGFSSQGDGAMFEGEVNDINKFTSDLNNHVKKAIANGLMDITWSVKHQGHYYHSYCTSISFDAGNYPGEYVSGKGWQGNIQSEIDKLEDIISESYRDLCNELYRSLEKENDYLTSRDSVIESIEANEYEFKEDGTKF